ncbi:glycosyltransferase [Ancylobacter terrae]|uniref:glycosyltransferase n=1 Tax=Ancylobacter sp. sgz301288 TaxID=3342077 RepID=UPI00385ADD28
MIPSHRSDLSHRSEQDQVTFFEDVLACTVCAEAEKGQHAHTIRLAGQTARLIFAGSALEALLMPAIAHLIVPPEEAEAPSLELHVWDSESTDVALVPPPVETHCFSERGDIWTFHSPRIRSAYHFSEYSLSLFDADREMGIFWVRTGRDLPYWTMASPFRSIFHWWMVKHDAQLVHAAAVGTAAGAVLITGRGGIGKSTSALSSLKAGLRYVGDDYVVLSAGDAPQVHSLYRTAKVHADNIADFAGFGPRFLGHGGQGEPEKAVMYLDHGLTLSMPLRAVVTPEFGHGPETGFAPAHTDLLVGAVSYSTIAQLPHAGPGTVDFIERLLSRLPCFRMILGHRRDAVPDAIAALLDGLRDSEPTPTTEVVTAPLVSVIIPVYNGARFLREAVDSILDQGHAKLEIIVVDDGSYDDVTAAVDALPLQVRFIRQENGGPAAARNTGLLAASADLIGFLDVDDLWPRGKLAAALVWLEAHPQADVVLGRAQLMEEDAAGDFHWVGSPAEAFERYIGAGLYRRRAFERAGMFDAALRFGEDTDWFASAAHAGLGIDRIDIVSLYVRRHAHNSTRGLSAPQVTPLRLLRNALQRKRQAESGT